MESRLRMLGYRKEEVEAHLEEIRRDHGRALSGRKAELASLEDKNDRLRSVVRRLEETVDRFEGEKSRFLEDMNRELAGLEKQVDAIRQETRAEEEEALSYLRFTKNQLHELEMHFEKCRNELHDLKERYRIPEQHRVRVRPREDQNG